MEDDILHMVWGTENENLTEAIQVFKQAWKEADEMGYRGHRVQEGLLALLDAGLITLVKEEKKRKKK